MTTKSAKAPSSSPWRFRSRLRRSTFGWRGSNAAITAIDEAVSEILAVSRRDPILGADGAVILLERVSLAVRDVGSSSGALGGATYSAVAAVVPIIVESLGDRWGELCATPELASRWADELPSIRQLTHPRQTETRRWCGFPGDHCVCGAVPSW